MTIGNISNGEIGYDVRSKMNNAINGVNELESIVDVESTYFTTTSTGDNTYVITSPETYTLLIGTLIKVRFNAANTNNAFTLNFNNTGAYRCYKNLSEAINPGELKQNGIYLVMFMGDSWSIIGTMVLIVDSLDDNSSWKALSSNQGRVIDGRLDTLESAVADHESDISTLQTKVTALTPIVLNGVSITIDKWVYSASDNAYIATITATGATVNDWPNVAWSETSIDMIKACNIKVIKTATNAVLIYLEACPTATATCDIIVNKKPA